MVFLYIFLATKFFSEYEYGIFVLLLTIINLSGLIFSFGIPNYLYELFSKGHNNHELGYYIKHILIIISFIIFFSFLFLNIYLEEISFLIFKDYNYKFILQILSVVIIFLILNLIYENYFIAKSKPIISILGNGILYPIFISILILIFYFYQLNFNIFLKLVLGSIPFITFFYLCYSKFDFTFLKSEFNKFKFYNIFFKLKFFFIISLSGSLFFYSDIILLAYLAEPATLSNYHLSIKIASLISLVSITNMSFNLGRSITLLKKKKYSISKKFREKYFNFFFIFFGDIFYYSFFFLIL